MIFSEGDLLATGAFCHTFSFFPISPSRSTFPTSNFFLCFQVRIVGGLFLSSQRYDSLFFHLLEINNRGKPPWILHYIHHSPVSLFFSPFPDSYRHKSVSLMGDNLRQSVQSLTLGINDASIALPPAIGSHAASINRFTLMITTVNPRKQNFSAPIGEIPWVWVLIDVCAGWILSPVKFQFKSRNEELMNLVLHRGPWSCNVWILTIHWWDPNITDQERKIILFWFRINGTSTLYLTNTMVRLIGSRIGLVTKISEGEHTIISFHYVRLRNFCSKYGSLKHDSKECPLIPDMYSDQRKDSYSQLVPDYMMRRPIVMILHHLFMNAILEYDESEEESGFLFTIDEVLTLPKWLLDFWDWVLVYLGLQVDSKNGTPDFKKRQHLSWQQIWVTGQRRLLNDQCESFPASSNVLISTKRQDTVFSPTTSSSHFKSKVMLKAFWSLSSKLIANNKYVKEGHNRFHLLARKAFDSRVTLHSFIEIVAISYICVQWLFCIHLVPCKLL